MIGGGVGMKYATKIQCAKILHFSGAVVDRFRFDGAS